jgi:hypothetical protein
VDRHYGAELDALRHTLATPTGAAEEAQVTGMRIALTTQLNADGNELRDDVARNLVLTALSQRDNLTLQDICREVGSALGLGNSIHESYFQPVLQRLAEEGQVDAVAQRYNLSKTGREEIKNRTAQGSDTVLEGKQCLRQAITTLTGTDPSSRDFAEIWSIVQDEVAVMFHANGMSIIQAIGSLSRDSTGRKVQDYPDISECIARIGTRIERLAPKNPTMQDFAQATKDAFLDKSSPTFHWLTQLCVAYVALCSLGLHPDAQRQVVSRIREIDLLLDTHFVLSFLSEGEDDHAAFAAMVKAWRRVGGRLYAAPPVLEESAYHAWISEHEMREVSGTLHTYTDEQARRLLQNVFVRGFRKTCSPDLDAASWEDYIANFRGKWERDPSSIRADLEANGILAADDSAVDRELARRLAAEVYEMRSQGLSDGQMAKLSRTYDLSQRDGHLLALLLHHRKMKLESGGSVAIVTSSSLLRKLCTRRTDIPGAGTAILPPGAIAYLLSLAPGAQLSLRSLGGVLYESSFREQMRPLEQKAMRIIHSSREYSLPYARRARLHGAMMERITRVAEELGKKAGELAEELEKGGPEKVEMLTEVVSKAVDTIARSASEHEIQELRRQNEELRMQLDAERRKKK